MDGDTNINNNSQLEDCRINIEANTTLVENA